MCTGDYGSPTLPRHQGQDSTMPFTKHRNKRGSFPSHGTRHERLTTAERGYDGKWQRYSRYYRRHHPLCVGVIGLPHSSGIRMVCNKPATDVDHIIEVSGRNDPLFWDATNHQSLCHECHAAKTARHMRGVIRSSLPSDVGGRVESHGGRR